MNTFVPTTADALRAALASTISCSAQELQEAAGQIVVATTGEVPQASVAGREARSLHDPATRTTVLLADHIPAGQEAQVLAQEIERHHGRQVAQAVLGDRAEELLGRDGMRLKYAAGEWNHLFGVGGKETRCRIVIDLEQPRLIAAQEWTGLKFEDVRGDRLRDLAESVIEVNEAHANLDDWKFERTSELPSWTGRREMTKNRFETEQEASDYKLKHQLYNRVAEPIGGGKWGLVYPIKSHIQVNDGAPAGMRQHHGEMHGNVQNTTVPKVERAFDQGLRLRTQALALLQEAHAADGLKPFTVTHTHSYGESTYVLWAAETPTQEHAKAVLDCEFEPDREETLAVEDCFTLEEMTGVAMTARLQDILDSSESPCQDDTPSP